MESAGFHVINGRSLSDCPAQYTHISCIGNSVIDLIWVNDTSLEYIDDLKVFTIPVHSDHFPIILSLKINSLNPILNNQKSNLKWKNYALNSYIDFMSQLTQVANLSSDVNELNANFESAVNNVACQIGMVN